MIAPLPIRARLTLWYSTVVVLCLAAFGTTIWIGLRQSLTAARQVELQERMGSLRAVLQQFEDQAHAKQENLQEEIEEFAKALPADFSLRVLDPWKALLYAPDSSRARRVLEREEVLQTEGRSLTLKMSVSLEPVDEILRQFSHIIFLSIPLALIVASVGGHWLSKQALSPVRDMAMAARSIDSANLSMRLPIPAADDELRLLAGMWNEMLERLQSGVERVQRFTSDASHDLRTPLATIRVSAEIALRRHRELESYRDTLERILLQTDRATILVEDLLLLARADRGHVDLELIPLDLGSSVSHICDNLRPLIERESLELRQSLPSNPVWINGNGSALARVIAVLVDNALKHTETGSIQIHLEATAHEAILKVEDTGRGIRSVDLPYIFDRFYRGDQSRTSVNGGSGLGLAIAKRLVESQLGSITVECEQGQGARFFVRLPLAPASL